MSERILVVQTCHLWQLIYSVRNLRRKNPGWRIEALVLDHPSSRAFLSRERVFDELYFSDFKTDPIQEVEDQYDRIVLPLLNRGYFRQKSKISKSALERTFSLSYKGELRRLKTGERLGSCFVPLDRPDQGFVTFLEEVERLSLSGNVLVLESDNLDRIQREVSRLPFEPDKTRLLRFQQITWKQLWQLWGGQRNQLDAIVVFLNQKPEHLFLQLLPLLLNPSRIIALDDSGSYFETTGTGYRRLILKRLLFGAPSYQEYKRILFIQTEAATLMIKALERLNEQPIFNRTKVSVLCRAQDAEILGAHPRVDEVIPFEKGQRWLHSLRTWRIVRDRNADVIAAVLTGRPVFRKQKLYYLLSTIRRHLVFNGALDSYWLSVSRLPRLIRNQPALDMPDIQHDVLFIQTETDELCRTAITQLVNNPRIVPNIKLTVLCREDKLSTFMEVAGVDRVLTYPRDGRVGPGWFKRLFSERPDVVAAIFSGRPIFMKQKILFFLIRAGNRLVFNDVLDCYYLNRNTFRYLMPFGKTKQRVPEMSSQWFVLPLKGVLFLPRFFYLVIWITLLRFRHWYTARRRGVDFP